MAKQCCQEMGKATHQFMAASQNKAKNAYKASTQAALTYFQSQLETDESALDALTLRHNRYKYISFAMGLLAS